MTKILRFSFMLCMMLISATSLWAADGITVSYPTEGMKWATINDGDKLATFTTTKEYAQVVIDIQDMDPAFDNIYKFPTRMFDNAGENSKDNLHVGVNTATTATPSAKPWNFFKGHTYKMIIKGFVNFWDVPDFYDAIAEVTFVGDGIEAETLSDVTLKSVFPANGTFLPEGPRVTTLTFSAPVASLKAVSPMGVYGSQNYSCSMADTKGLKWNVNLGSLSVDSEDGAQSSLCIEISGKDAAGNVLNLGDNAARAYICSYTISKNAKEPVRYGNTIDAGRYSITADVEVPAGMSIPTDFQKYIGHYTTDATLIGDESKLTISENAEGGLFDGFVIVNDAVAYSEDLSIELGGKEFFVRGLDGSVSGKLSITAVEDGYVMDGAAIWYMGQKVATVNNIAISVYKEKSDVITEPRSWNFKDGSAVTADTENWGAVDSKGRTSLQVALDDELLPNSTFEGIYFTVAKGAVYGVSNNYCLQSSSITTRIPNCGEGDVISIEFAGAGSEATVTSDNIIEGVSTTVTKAGTSQDVTVAADGDVVLSMKCSKGFRLYNITVTPASITSIYNATPTVKTVNVKLIENGKLVIVKNGVKYNAAGMIVK